MKYLPFKLSQWLSNNFIPEELLTDNETVMKHILAKDGKTAVITVQRLIYRRLSAKENYQLVEIINNW